MTFAQDLPNSVYVSTRTTAFGESDALPTESMSAPGSVSSHSSFQGSSSGLVGSATSTAWGRVGTGYMQLRTFGQANIGGYGPYGQISTEAQARANLTDSFMITCPACVDGTEATLTVRVYAHGDVAAAGSPEVPPQDSRGSIYSAHGDVSSYFHLSAADANIPGEPAESFMSLSIVRYGQHEDYRDRPFWREGITARITLGQPLTFNWSAWAQGGAVVGNYTDEGKVAASSAYFSDFGSTLYWGGIEELRDAQGQLLTDVHAFNASGVDYALALPPPPIPEPSTAWLMLLGMGALAVRQRRRAHQPPV
ncbi:PEP-CTERM sorting domain-containing protein [Roseateles terrae]|uniref:Ice-binding protein C-terminal domain-containing protein n=1 Tax=Roseateles terrae TaxID=431060 RepID=A0ABR6GLX6_9BURK|nr:PEP-CTERM sorting domain-containing protein [Roseateles terrae]MBB3193115.1 hypothetical protein [Roseateles terrae]